jgi:type IV secretion system protein VirD4
LQLRGVRPFFSDKYDITRHKNYHLLLDDNPKNEFDIEKYVNRKKRMLFKPSSMDRITEFAANMTAGKEVKTDNSEIEIALSDGEEPE